MFCSSLAWRISLPESYGAVESRGLQPGLQNFQKSGGAIKTAGLDYSGVEQWC